MKSIKILLLSLLLLTGLTSINFAQINTNLSFQVLDLTTIPLQRFLNFSTANLEDINQESGIFIIVNIDSQQPQVVLNGRLNWQSPDGNFSGEVFSFASENITLNPIGVGFPYSIRFNNQDIGDGNQVDIKESTSNSDLIEEVAKIGKISGIVDFSLWCTDPVSGETISNVEYQQQIFTNDVPNFTILDPTSDSQLNQNGFIVQWNSNFTSAEAFLIVINENSFDSKDDAVSGFPNLNKEFDNIGGQLTQVILTPGDFLRDLVAEKTYYLGVFAKLPSISAGGYEYLPAENNGFSISLGTTGNTTQENAGNDLPPNAPTFAITNPLFGNEFTVNSDNPSVNFEWESVDGVQEYEFVLTYLGNDEGLIQQARSDVRKTIIPGLEILRQTVSQTNFTLSNLPSTQQFNDNDYLVMAVYAKHPSFGDIRSTGLRLGKIFTEDQGTEVNETNIDELLNSLDFNTALAVDEDGNPISGEALRALLEQIKNGTIQGRLIIRQ